MTPEAQSNALEALRARIEHHLGVIYPDGDIDATAGTIMDIMGYGQHIESVEYHVHLWDERDIIAITYCDSITRDDQAPLDTLREFFNSHLRDIISTVHILPFYPFSSDDGFAVIDYTGVNPECGDWQDIEGIATEYKLMADLVINHCSSRSAWFVNYTQGKDPGRDYFIECDPGTDLGDVVRPRTSQLLRKTATAQGDKYVWCTFSHDQVDLDFSNPAVLIEMVRIIKLYLDKGVRLFRLDAVAFLWKRVGTSCINLPETHEMVRLLRLLIEHVHKDAIIITETNIPNRENLSYFGNANEAHMIYNFALPPLILYTMLKGDSSHIKSWMMSMPPAQNGTTYFNFIASHDGIGLRPVEGILSDEQVDEMVELVTSFGGEVSWRSLDDDKVRPYELNVSLIDAFKGTFTGGIDDHRIDRFICAHAIMMALEGIPAFYIHSLLATSNDHGKVALTGSKRAINRHNWSYAHLVDELEDDQSIHRRAFTRLSHIIATRKRQKAFHPGCTQFTMHFGESIFGFWRQSPDRTQSIFCIYNVSNDGQVIPLKDINLIVTDEWRDLVTGYRYTDAHEDIVLKPYDFVWISNR